ncbi:MAG: TetR/AcrR family transcriptional regulator [Clostridia bacterium]|nr:TetR/AcrR family transcriptional regulator [Clostridia bacterium]
MAKRFLTRELIVSVAFQMVDENGLDGFSVRQLAAKLGVQGSSLYNHIKNEYDIFLEVAKLAADMYANYVAEYTKGLPLDEATLKAGDAFRNFLKEHPHLYKLLLDQRFSGDPEFDKVLDSFTTPIYVILQMYGVEDKAEMDRLYIAMRVVTHGFGSLDSTGVFDSLSVDATESYHNMIKAVIDVMKKLGKKTEETS